jgi:hypothetical protein
MPIILATQKAAFRRIGVGSQPRQIVHKTLYQKRAGRMAQATVSACKCETLSSNSSTAKKKKKKYMY